MAPVKLYCPCKAILANKLRKIILRSKNFMPIKDPFTIFERLIYVKKIDQESNKSKLDKRELNCKEKTRLLYATEILNRLIQRLLQ